VAAGFNHTCALDTSGEAWCWGSNQFGQLGVQTIASCPEVGTCARRPIQVSGGHSFTAIASGVTHSCALKANGEAWCWGGGYEFGGLGYLGDGAVRQSFAPVRVAADSAFTQIAVGAGNSCALTASGQAWCWGRNTRGEVGDSTQGARRVPTAIGGAQRFAAISMGLDHTCALRDNGSVACWGYNRVGQLGTDALAYNVEAYRLAPTRVNGGPYEAIAAGGEHTCALRTTGVVDCWGHNANAGQLGDSSGVTHRGVPGPIAKDSVFTTLAAGGITTCGRTASGASFCWGGNFYGSLGDGTRGLLPAQEPVLSSGGPFVRYSGGGLHMCGLDAADRLFCWGDTRYGQVGN
jgi:alpha-tubulin suppressor-like RCC1 family protein